MNIFLISSQKPALWHLITIISMTYHSKKYVFVLKWEHYSNYHVYPKYLDTNSLPWSIVPDKALFFSQKILLSSLLQEIECYGMGTH